MSPITIICPILKRGTIIALLISVLSLADVIGQSEMLLNPSLERETTGDLWPFGWFGKPDEIWNDPSLKAFYRSGDSEITEATPIDGNIFVLLRTRGANTPPGINDHGPYQQEYMIQRLQNPLVNGGCYIFSAYMQRGYEENAQPLIMQLWGGNGQDYFQTTLCESEIVTNTQWEQQTFEFNTAEKYDYVTLTVMWDYENVDSEAYDGIILFDKLSLKQGVIGDTIEHIEFYEGDGIHVLEASEGTRYEWTKNKVGLSNDTIRNPLVNFYAQDFEVRVFDTGVCPSIEIFELIKYCEERYGTDNLSETDIYLQRDTTWIMPSGFPSSLVKWKESDLAYLGSIDQWPVYLKFYKEEFTLNYLYDSNNCAFHEKFNIIINCDTLYPGGVLHVMDTTSDGFQTIELNTLYGEINKAWEPPYQLSCNNCQTTLASPNVTINYRVEMIDTISCIHTEYFNIEIPVKVPNVITPNNDGVNDCFMAPGIPQNTALYVFDKEGRERYSTKHYDLVGGDCWEGTDHKGAKLDAGNYWFVLEHPERGVLKKGFIYIKR